MGFPGMKAEVPLTDKPRMMDLGIGSRVLYFLARLFIRSFFFSFSMYVYIVKIQYLSRQSMNDSSNLNMPFLLLGATNPPISAP